MIRSASVSMRSLISLASMGSYPRNRLPAASKNSGLTTDSLT
jgi:hypothetical protein